MSEKTKLETMFYHKREARHRRWLDNNLMYRRWRTLGRDACIDAGLDEGTELAEGTNTFKTQSSLAPVVSQMQRAQPIVGAKCVFCGNRVKYRPINGIDPRTHEKCWQEMKGQLLRGKS